MSLALLLDLYELTMAQSYFVYKRKSFATFDLFVRDLPNSRSYLMAAGLEGILGYIGALRFRKEDLEYLTSQKIFTPAFLKYLANFRFRGDIWAMPEGEIFFANEPILRVTAPIIEAQLIESFLLNTINLESMIASKASRVVNAAKGRKVYDFSFRRAHGPEAGIKVARSSFIAGVSGSSCVESGKSYKIPIVGTMAHAYVMSFKKEIDSFRAYCNIFPDKSTLLVDTYETKKGIENAIAIGLELERKGYQLKGIRLDSGNIAELSKLARKMLDKAGLNYVKILASGNLDEFKIKALLEKGAKVDIFGVGTNMGTSSDAPSLDVIYKISEVSDEEGKFLPTMKLSKGKITYPGRKQVFRNQDSKGRFTKDILGLENERIKGRPLLKKVVQSGRVVYKAPSLYKIRDFAAKNLSRFPEKLKDVRAAYKYPVITSQALNKLRRSLSRELENEEKNR